MISPATSYHSAQDAALRASADLVAAVGSLRLYTEVPANAALPYVLIGEDQILLEIGGCAGEAEIFATVNWWAKTSPRDKGSQARLMGSAIIDALLTDLTLTGHTVDEWELQSESYGTDPDGSTHGRAVFHYLTTQQVA